MILHFPRIAAADLALTRRRQRKEAVLGFIRSAETHLLLSVFRCDDRDVLREIGRAIERGVHVEALVTSRVRGWAGRLDDLAEKLERKGVLTHRFEKGTKYHAKYLIADHRRALVATFNLTTENLEQTCDFGLITEDESVVDWLKAIFHGDAVGQAMPLTVSERLILAPGNARQRWMQLLTAATRSIRILDHKLCDPEVLGLLARKRLEGVSVEIVRVPRSAHHAHGRLVLIDNQMAVVGSFALTPMSLDWRRELALITYDAVAVAEFHRYFAKVGPKTRVARAA